MNDTFLPQFSARAVADLDEWNRSAFKNRRILSSAPLYIAATKLVAAMLRNAVHVVLPPNGEIYRPNRLDEPPTPSECESFVGLPAPMTAFEYAWTYSPEASDGEWKTIAAPRRITLVIDGKQTTTAPLPAGHVHTATLFSIVYDESVKHWGLLDTTLCVSSPLRVSNLSRNKGSWGLTCVLRDLIKNQELEADDYDTVRIFGEWKSDLQVVIQACHALRAGADLHERTEQSSARRARFARQGVGGFVYHVLTLPKYCSDERSVGGTHASPRFHVRRAHIRQLPSGALTFVRQHFVGDRANGEIGKHYELRGAAPVTLPLS